MITLFKQKLSPEHKALCALIGRSSLFKDLKVYQLALLIPHLYVRRFEKGEIIFYRGDPSMALYFIKSGKLEAYLDDALEREVLARLKEGDSVGHNMVLKKADRLFNVMVTSPEAELLALPQDPLFELMRNHLSIRASLMLRFSLMSNDRLENLLGHYCQSRGVFHIGDASVLDMQ